MSAPHPKLHVEKKAALFELFLISFLQANSLIPNVLNYNT